MDLHGLPELTFEESQEEAQVWFTSWSGKMSGMFSPCMVCPHIGTIRVVLHLERGVYFQIARVYAKEMGSMDT